MKRHSDNNLPMERYTNDTKMNTIIHETCLIMSVHTGKKRKLCKQQTLIWRHVSCAVKWINKSNKKKLQIYMIMFLFYVQITKLFRFVMFDMFISLCVTYVFFVFSNSLLFSFFTTQILLPSWKLLISILCFPVEQRKTITKQILLSWFISNTLTAYGLRLPKRHATL